MTGSVSLLVNDLTPAQFVSHSLELNLFFLRIMKEHSLFLTAGFPCKDTALIDEALGFNTGLTNLLAEVIGIANGNIRASVLSSRELVTPRTLDAEKKTAQLTGLPIDTTLTTAELELTAGNADPQLEDTVRNLNERIINMVKSFTEYKKDILNDVLVCRLYTHNFPTMLEHLVHEGEHYLEHLENLQMGKVMDPMPGIMEEKVFWDHIMADHGHFIAHLLDPAEKDLIKKASRMAVTMTALEQRAKDLQDSRKIADVKKLVSEEIVAVKALSNFKMTGEEMILACKIKSLIPPLLADHVLREANHFLRGLEEVKMPNAKSKPKSHRPVKRR